MATFTLELRDEGGANESKTIEADTPDEAREIAESEAKEWAEGGEWGEDGASVWIGWTLRDEDGDEVDSDSIVADIKPDHTALIRRAGGDPDCDHDWTSEGEGGLAENPGVWSDGGTALIFASHCRTCGLRRWERTTGSQRNPGEHDTVYYEQPEMADND